MITTINSTLYSSTLYIIVGVSLSTPRHLYLQYCDALALSQRPLEGDSGTHGGGEAFTTLIYPGVITVDHFRFFCTECDKNLNIV